VYILSIILGRKLIAFTRFSMRFMTLKRLRIVEISTLLKGVFKIYSSSGSWKGELREGMLEKEGLFWFLLRTAVLRF
jgi:hypothetical protein